MPIYRGPGAWGAGKGSEITYAEEDGQFYDIEQRLLALEAAVAAMTSRSIESIDIAGTLLTITYTDATTDEFTVPVARFRARGQWVAGETYATNDVVTYGGGAYLALTSFVAGDVFDPGESELWGPLIPALAMRGQPGKVVSASTYDLTESDIATPYLRFTNAGGCVVTIPGGDDDNFALWDELTLRSATDGDVIIEWDSDVTTNLPPDKVGILLGNGATAAIKKVDDLEWDVCGLLQDLGSV